MSYKMLYVKVKKALDGNNIDGDGRAILAKVIEVRGNVLILREYGVDEIFALRPTSDRVLGNSIPSTRCVVMTEEYAVAEIYKRTGVKIRPIKNIIEPLDICDIYPNIKWHSEE